MSFLEAYIFEEDTTGPVIELNGGEGVNPDLGLEICAEIDRALEEDGIDLDKPSELTLTLGDVIGTADSSIQPAGKSSVSTLGAEDGDGAIRVRVSDDEDPNRTDTVYFEGDLSLGDTFTALASNAGNDTFLSDTYIHLFDDNGALLQTIQYHTSCSAPILIGDTIGTVTLSGVGLRDINSQEVVRYGLADARGDDGVVYQITGGGDAALFQVDAATGEVSFINPPDFEDPLDTDADNIYDVEVTAFYTDPNGVKTGEVCDVTPLEIRVRDEYALGSLSGRYFCDTNDNNVDDNNGDEPGIAGVFVELLDANGNVTGATTVTGADGNYSFSDIEPGIYSVRFTDPNDVLAGKVLVAANVGQDDATDSDAIGDVTLSTINGIVVGKGSDTRDNDAGAEYALGSLSGRYFCDLDSDGLDGSGDIGLQGRAVTLLEADGETVVASTLTGADGEYSFSDVVPGFYVVAFENSYSEGKGFVTPDIGGDDTIDSDVVDVIGGKTAPVMVVAGQETGDIDAGVSFLSYEMKKDISNIVVYLDCDGEAGGEITKVKFDEFQWKEKVVDLAKVSDALDQAGFEGCDLLGLSIKAGREKGNFGPGEGLYYDLDPTDDFVTGTKDKADFEFMATDYFDSFVFG